MYLNKIRGGIFMAKRGEIYKCPVCGNVVEIINAGGGTLVCCDKPMIHVEENTVDAAHEKHIPVVEKTDDGLVKVQVGSVEHPMQPEHYIMWIEVITESKVYKKYLNPGEKPEASFKIHEEIIAVREYCNIHGLWKA